MTSATAHISSLTQYPIKSCGGMVLEEAEVDASGFRGDRCLVLVDSNGESLSQDEVPRLALIQPRLVANELEAGYCGKYLFVFAGQTCPRHHHQTKHETFFIMKGRVRMTCGETTREMSEGEVLAVKPGQVHSFIGISPALLLELSMPCRVDDNYFENRDIPYGGNYRGGSRA